MDASKDRLDGKGRKGHEGRSRAGEHAGAAHAADGDDVPAGVRGGDGLQRLLGQHAAARRRLRLLLPAQVPGVRGSGARADARAGARRGGQSAHHHGAPAGGLVRARGRRPHPPRGRQRQRRPALDRPRPAAVPALRAAEDRARAVLGDAAGQAARLRTRPARAGAPAADGRGGRLPARLHPARPRHRDGDRVHDRGDADRVRDAARRSSAGSSPGCSCWCSCTRSCGPTRGRA